MADSKSSASSSSSSTSSELPTKMKAIVFTKTLTEPKGIEIIEWPMPKPKASEVLIKVKCFGLNFADTLARKGQYGDAPAYPYVPGYECSGVVVELGDGVTKLKKGDRVMAFTGNFGSYAQYAVSNEGGCALIPVKMSFAEAASIPVVFATAYHCLCGVGPSQKGDKVLIHAAAGGVGLAAVQIAKLNGLVVFGTASSPEKIKLLQDDYKVDHVINYRQNDFVTEIQRIEATTDGCIDIILDSIGGSYFKKELPLLRYGGRLVGYGASAVSDRSMSKVVSLVSNVVSMLTFSTVDLMLNSKSFIGVNMKKFGEAKPNVVAEYLSKIIELFTAEKLRTIVKEYSWEEISTAHRDIESRHTSGKLVLRVEADDA